MKEQPVDSQVRRIENKHWDELNIVLDVDLSYLTLEYLEELKVKWEAQYALVKKMFRQLIRLVAFSPVWFVVGLTSMMLTEDFILTYVIFLFPISVFLFVAGMVYISIRYGGKNRQEEIGKVIKAELKKRYDEKRRNWFL